MTVEMTPEEMVADLVKFSEQAMELVESLGETCNGKEIGQIAAALITMVALVAEDAPDELKIQMAGSLRAMHDSILESIKAPEGVPIQ